MTGLKVNVTLLLYMEVSLAKDAERQRSSLTS